MDCGSVVVDGVVVVVLVDGAGVFKGLTVDDVDVGVSCTVGEGEVMLFGDQNIIPITAIASKTTTIVMIVELLGIL